MPHATLFPMIAFSRVTKTYGETLALSDVTFAVRPHECVCITGPANAGKSTIVRLLLRAEAPHKGTISIDNVDLQLVPPAVLRLYRQRIGLKLAEGNLFLRKTVAENLTFPLLLRGIDERACSRSARSMMERLGLLSSADRSPSALTAEARTLLGLGRALIGTPMILLLDEPFAELSLDAFALTTGLLTEAHRNGATVICCSRDESIASALNARHIRMASGKILDDLPPETTEEAPLSPGIHHLLTRLLLPSRNQSVKEKMERAQKVEVTTG